MDYPNQQQHINNKIPIKIQNRKWTTLTNTNKLLTQLNYMYISLEAIVLFQNRK